MPERERKQTRPDVAALEAEIVRLNKIVQALMDRSESSTNVQDSDFGLFQATVMLQDQVRLHTEELEAALHDKERGEAGAPASAPADMQALRRTAALQIQLLELVVQQKDVGELIERVATILDMPVVLFDARGQAVSTLDGRGERARLRAASLDGIRGSAGRPRTSRDDRRRRRPHLLPRRRRDEPRRAGAGRGGLAAAVDRVRRRLAVVPAAARHARPAAPARRAAHAPARAPRSAARPARRRRSRGRAEDPPAGAGLRREERAADRRRRARATPRPTRERRRARGRPSDSTARCSAHSTPCSAGAGCRS